MNYNNKNIAITGASGFIGSALYDQLFSVVAPGPNYIERLDGDVRLPETFEKLDHTFDYLFHFAAPSSQVLFKRQPFYSAEVTLEGFMNAAKACSKHGIKLIYPSTGLLSGERTNEYARCKQICEDMARDIDALGLRIFATYGPGEGHKRDYASVPYLFARDVVAGRSPVVYGDGEQIRDFIYIDDCVQAILHAAEECPDKVLDIGTGHGIAFNEILKRISVALGNAVIAVDNVQRPDGYVMETVADPTRMYDFYKPKYSFSEGILELIKELKETL